ncbi:MAG: hypothetical protein ACYTFI_01120 [Planctomycetota bacterium]|jgi:hypothetical protein
MLDDRSPGRTEGGGTGTVSIVAAAAWLFLSFTSPAAGSVVKEAGEVHLSDGTVIEGTVQLTPTSSFLLWILPKGATRVGSGNKKIREFNFDAIRELSFKPFGARRKCFVTFNSGEELEGILRSTVVYVYVKKIDGMRESGVRKFVLKSHLREKQKVKTIRITSPGRRTLAKMPLVLNGLKLGKEDRLMAVTAETLAPVRVTPLERPGRFEVGSTNGEKVFVAARKGDTYLAAWPAEGTRKSDLYEEVEIHLTKIAEYYNERKLLGIMVNRAGTEVTTLLSLRRQVSETAAMASAGQFDDDGAIEHFRLSIWRWKRNPENGEMALVKRGSFCRDRVSPHAETPHAEVSAALWPVVHSSERVTVGSPGNEGRKGR